MRWLGSAHSEIVLRDAIALLKSLRLELPRQEVALPCVAIDARWHPVIEVVCAPGRNRDEMIYFPCCSRPNHSVIRERQLYLAIEAQTASAIVDIVEIIVRISHGRCLTNRA